MQIELSWNNSPLVIAVKDNDGNLLPIQELDQFLYEKQDLRILCMLHGRELFDILYDDHGLIRYDENKFALSEIIRLNPENSVMKIMGKVGESVLVRRCTQYEDLNMIWMRIASKRQIQKSTAAKYIPVGTGFKSTSRDYPRAYNPNDTQRDIIWIDKEVGNHYLMNGSTRTAGLDAGLQIKVSTNGMNYVYRDLVDAVYEVPVVYFDLNNDFGLVYRNIQRELNRRGDNSRELYEWFVSGRDADPAAFDEIKYYTEMVRAIVNNRLSIDDLINRAEKYPSFGSAVIEPNQ